ncbi:hypothetical protein SBA3_100046 [Candidatus Sulfopaludibacter sp. SbA3]|nr:hypothetical protein SBA3_100046 [Candidatus Sulfopaludibacter sp. SbA3]
MNKQYLVLSIIYYQASAFNPQFGRKPLHGSVSLCAHNVFCSQRGVREAVPNILSLWAS